MEFIDVKKPFGLSVKALRRRLGISQEELAGRAGLHRTYVCDIERGARNVSLESIQKLAGALEVSLPTLFRDQPAPDASVGESIDGEELVDILFVEDDPNDIKLAMEALKFISNRVEVIRNGLDALDYLFGTGAYAGRTRTARPQVILLDLGLPGLGGLDVLRRAKADARTASIPVVILTSSTREHDLRVSKQLGAAAYIPKPVDLRNLSGVAPGLSLHWALLKPVPAWTARV